MAMFDPNISGGFAGGAGGSEGLGGLGLPPGLGSFVGGVLTKSTPTKTLVGKGGLLRGAEGRHPSGSVAGIEVPESFKDMLPDISKSVTAFGTLNPKAAGRRFGFGQPFNVDQFRDAAAFTSPDSQLITEYFRGIKPFLSNIGRGDIGAELDTLTAGFHNAGNFHELRARQSAAVQIAGAIRNELTGQLGENPEALDRFKAFEQGFRNTQQLRLFEREKTELLTSGFSFQEPDPGTLDVGEFEPESIRRNRRLAGIFSTRLSELGRQIPELKEKIGKGGVPQPGDPDFVGPVQGGDTGTMEEPPEDRVKRVIKGAARQFMRLPLPKTKFSRPAFGPRGFTPTTGVPPGGGGDFFDLEKEEDLIIPSGFTSKLATTQSRALALKGLR